MNAFFERTKAILIAGGVALAILAVGQGIWGAMAFANVHFTPAIPWAAPVMLVPLYGLWRVLARRPDLLQANRVSRGTLLRSVAAGAIGIGALTGYWIVFSDLVRMQPNTLPPVQGLSPLMLIALAVVGSLAAPFSEEAAFRGYAQSILRRRFSLMTATIITSVFFALAHVPHGLLLPKLFVYFLGGLMFGMIANASKSILPGIAVHVMADLTFFAMVWPYDAARHNVFAYGADASFWLHLAQALVCTALFIPAVQSVSAGIQGGIRSRRKRTELCTADDVHQKARIWHSSFGLSSRARTRTLLQCALRHSAKKPGLH